MYILSTSSIYLPSYKRDENAADRNGNGKKIDDDYGPTHT